MGFQEIFKDLNLKIIQLVAGSRWNFTIFVK